MSAHTPGPWSINGVAAGGWRIDSLTAGRVGIEFLTKPVALVPDGDDARLVAAAPSMLEALRAAEWGGCCGVEGEYRACPVCGNPDPEDIDIVQPSKRTGFADHEPGCLLAAAIAKAEGREL